MNSRVLSPLIVSTFLFSSLDAQITADGNLDMTDVKDALPEDVSSLLLYIG